jgi:hypothetical protein
MLSWVEVGYMSEQNGFVRKRRSQKFFEQGL